MIKIRNHQDRGKSQHDWLQSFHSFSFAQYYHPDFMGFGKLRVINEDTVQPGKGFGMHSHNNMEIISYVIEGVMEHKDSMGNGSLIKPGEIQRMSAGQGVQHSEFNHSGKDSLHFLQIWIIPAQIDLTPSYEQIPLKKVSNRLILIGAEHAAEGAVTIHQDVKLFCAFMTEGHTLQYSIGPDRLVWLQMIKGQILLNNQLMFAGDGAALVNENNLGITCEKDAEYLLFDLSAL